MACICLIEFAARTVAGEELWSQKVALTRYFVVPPLGLEPRTCGLRVRCSAIELEGRVWRSGSVGIYTTGRQHVAKRPRVTDGTRTRDSQYHKLELYQLSYGHHEGCIFCHTRRPVPPVASRSPDGRLKVASIERIVPGRFGTRHGAAVDTRSRQSCDAIAMRCAMRPFTTDSVVS
jgi:hypothetical protein